MGLTPAYVDVLQRQWTQDDLATITNTYPDHEDLQGPSGFNVGKHDRWLCPAPISRDHDRTTDAARVAGQL